MSNAFLWNVAGGIWLLLGSIQFMTWALDLTPIRFSVATLVVTGVVPIVFSAVWFAAGARDIPVVPWFHFPLALGLAVIIAGSLLDSHNRGAAVAYPMVPMVCALVLFPLGYAWPYVIGANIGAAEEILLGQGPDPGARLAVTMLIVLAIAGILALGQLQLHRSLKRSRELTEVDALTGVANVRALVEHMRHEFTRPVRAGSTVGLIAFDLDEFKLVNDTFGHSLGDRMLIGVARAVEALLEPGDLIARRGGDEFTVAAIDRPDRSLQRLAQRIAKAVEEAREEIAPTVDPHVSVGFVLRRSGESLEQLFERADVQLHDSKATSHARRGGARSREPESRLVPRSVVDRRAEGAYRDPRLRPAVEQPSTTSRTVTSWRLIGISYAVFALLTPALGFVARANELLAPAGIAIASLSAAAAIACFVCAGRVESR
ncbi:MAG: diguanylate cyclase domain-containing protein, partial [Solirubrobacterales bacterium]